MADNTVHSTSPVGGISGLQGRAQPSQRPPATDSDSHAPAAEDRVMFRPVASIALRLLRERVLARTRQRLELDEAVVVPVFAEVVEGEPVPKFLGRLLSAQNQLAALRAASWEPVRVREALMIALRQGADETVELLTADGEHVDEGVAIVFEVLAEFERRVAAMLDS
jgi:hypothetical protein